MKKKLLAVVLAAAMVLGVLSFSGCSGANPNDNYNYYTSVYESMADVAASDVRIKPLTYNGIYNMFKTPGNFIVLWGGYYDKTTQDNIKKVNDLALSYGITVYNFDPILDAKIGLDDADGTYNTASADLTDANIGAVSAKMGVLRDKLLAVMNVYGGRFPAQGSLLHVQGAAYEVEVSLSGDSQATVTYKGQIKAQSNNPIMLESVIQSACFRVPNYLKYKNEDGTFAREAYDPASINEFNVFNDYRFHMAGDDVACTSDFTGESASVFEALTYHAMLDLLKNGKGMFAVFYGGAWCHNTQAVAKFTSDLAKDYGMSKIYVYDNCLDNGVTEDSFQIVDEAVEGQYTLDVESGALVPLTQKAVQVNHNLTPNGNPGYIAKIDTRSDEVTTPGSVSYSHLYARLIDECMPGYVSMFNDAEHNLTIKGKKEAYTQMCVPCLMLFDGDKENQAEKLVDFAEVEYEWDYEPYQLAWESAVKALFDQNKYASYNPPVEEETSTDGTTESESSSSDSSSSSGSTGSTPPAGGAC